MGHQGDDHGERFVHLLRDRGGVERRLPDRRCVAHFFCLLSTLLFAHLFFCSRGPIAAAGLQQLVDLLVPSVVVPFINAAIAKGFPLPTFDGLTLYNTEVTTLNNTLEVSSDVRYTPPPIEAAAPTAAAGEAAAPLQCTPSGQECLICTNCPSCCSGTCSLNGICV